jgi:hypothetical protein
MTRKFQGPASLASEAGPSYVTEAEPRDVAGEVVLVAALSSPADHTSYPVDELVIGSREAGPAAVWLQGADGEDDAGETAPAE